MPRFLLLLRANHASESGRLPTDSELKEMGSFNASLQSIEGEILGADGLQLSARGARVVFPSPSPPTKSEKKADEPAPAGEITVTPGPFPCQTEGDSGRVVSGFWIIRARNMEDVVEWVKKAPVETEIEIRPIIELSEIGK